MEEKKATTHQRLNAVLRTTAPAAAVRERSMTVLPPK
jgi:hypothetical protein